MQASWRTRRRIKRYILVGVVSALVAFGFTQGQDWANDVPWWEYEDETPIIPVDIRLKLFELDKAYHRAGDYHNDHFVKEYTRREHPNAAFDWRWTSFRARWIGFNDFYALFQHSVLINAASVSASGTAVDFDHMQLAGRTLLVLEGLAETARDLTYYLEDDIVISKWEIFIRRLTQLEDALKDLK